VASKNLITAKRLFDLAAVLRGRHLIHVTVGPTLDPVLLSLEKRPDYRIQRGSASFSKDRADRSNQFRIHRLVGPAWQTVALAPTNENYHFVQPLPNARWLLVRSRANGEQDHNARVYEPDGKAASSFHAGDGIADVQATEQGHIWVSFFDEGVFGGSPLGGHGLVSLDNNGRPVFRLGDLADPVRESMADCYALNVCSGKEVWLYYYTDFPLVQLLEGTVADWWPTRVYGSHGFAVADGWGLFGGSFDRQDSLFLGELAMLHFREITPTEEGGKPLKGFRPFGRRHLLYLATDSALHVVDLRSL
jgi:hypothetical protein